MTRRSRRLRLAFALVVVAVTGLAAGSFWRTVYHTPGVSVYPTAASAPSWVQSPDGAPETWFRLPVSLDSPPQSAILWIDADQQFVLYVDGIQVAKSNDRLPLRPTTQSFDVTPWLAAGNHAVGIRVSNHDDRPAAISARIRVSTGGQFIDYDTGRAPWRCSADPSRVDVTGLNVPSFAVVGFNDSGWQPAAVTAGPRAIAPTTSPTWVMDDPLSAAVIGGGHRGSDVTATGTVDVVGEPGDGWLRVGASGPFVLFINGDQVAYRPASQARLSIAMASSTVPPQSPPSLIGRRVVIYPQSIFDFDVGPLLHSGINRISVRVRSSRAALVYVDGRIQGTPTGRVASGVGWSVTDPTDEAADAAGAPPTIAGDPAAVWSNGVVKVVVNQSVLTPSGWVTLIAMVLFPLSFVAAWLAVGLANRRGWGSGVVLALQRDALAHLPMLGLLTVVVMLGRMTNLTPPFPYVTWVFVGLLALLVATRLLMALSSLGGRSTGDLAKTTDALTPDTLTPDTVTGPMDVSSPTRHRPGRPRRLLARACRGWYGLSVGAVSIFLGAVFSYRLDYAPFWQDELASLAAAQGIRAHILPQWPSGYLYFKSELYSVLIALVGAVTGDKPIPLRFVSVLWFAGTVAVLGLMLVPLVIRARPWVRLAVVVLFATSPFEIVWARDLRMYQQAQFFFVLFLACYIKALRAPGRRSIAAAVGSLLLMYFSHEETFIILFAVPVMLPIALRLTWVRDLRWWLIGGAGVLTVLAQFAIATRTHGPSFGYDRLNAPLVSWDTSDPYGYLNLVYFGRWTAADPVHVLTFVSSFAVIATITGIVRRNFERIYLAVFLWVPVLALTFVLSLKSGRYTFVTLPALFLLGSLGFLDVLGWIRAGLMPKVLTVREAMVGAWTFRCAAVLGGMALALTMVATPADYGLVAARITGVKYVHAHPDYDYVIAYMKQHEQPGDLFITLCPPNVPAYYLGRSPDYIITVHPYDRFLYLLEKNGQAVDTQYGVPQIFSARDLEHVLATHRRIWLVSDQGAYLNSVLPEVTALVQSNFRWVSAGRDASLYFRD